jgi:hypothetical protein
MVATNRTHGSRQTRRLAAALEANADKITPELLLEQGKPVDIGGYYLPDDAKCAAVMRPSVTLNAITDGMEWLLPVPAARNFRTPEGRQPARSGEFSRPGLEIQSSRVTFGIPPICSHIGYRGW